MNDPPKLACRRRKWRKRLVREERLELSRIAPLDPKSSAYASFATLARKSHILQGDEFNTALRRRQEEERPSGPCGAAFLRVGEAMGEPFGSVLRRLFSEQREEVSAGSKRGRSRCRPAPERDRRQGRLFRGVRKRRAGRSCAARRNGAKGRKAGCKEKRKESCAFGSAPACRAGTPVKERPRAGQGLCPHAA